MMQNMPVLTGKRGKAALYPDWVQIEGDDTAAVEMPGCMVCRAADLVSLTGQMA